MGRKKRHIPPPILVMDRHHDIAIATVAHDRHHEKFADVLVDALMEPDELRACALAFLAMALRLEDAT